MNLMIKVGFFEFVFSLGLLIKSFSNARCLVLFLGGAAADISWESCFLLATGSPREFDTMTCSSEPMTVSALVGLICFHHESIDPSGTRKDGIQLDCRDTFHIYSGNVLHRR